jgi:hypothetical protein
VKSRGKGSRGARGALLLATVRGKIVKKEKKGRADEEEEEHGEDAA